MKLSEIIPALAEGMVPFVREVVTEATTPLITRITEIEGRATQKGDAGERGPQGGIGPEGPAGPKGETGRDGRDASDLALVFNRIDEQVAASIAGMIKAVTSPDGGRTLRWAIGETVHEIKTAIVLDAGVWKEGTAYVAGDGVTLGGSFFIAQSDTTAKPGKSDEWRLAVKRGSDGRDARTERALEPVRFK